ncbi:MAG: hypothetical protein AB7O62_13650 [Pirellulales bacterium]
MTCALLGYSLRFFPVFSPGLVLAIGCLLLALLAYGSRLLRRKHVPPRSVAALAILRAAMVVLFCLGLLHPVLSYTRSVAQAPDVLVMVDASQSMNAASAAGDGSRWYEALRTLQTSPALQSAAQQRNLHWFTFDRRATPTTPQDLAQLSAQGTGTDFAASLAAAANHVRLLNAESGEGSAPARLLLVSDGQDQGTSSAVDQARLLGLAVDVLIPTGQGPAAGSSAVTIEDVQAPTRVLLGSECAFQVTLDPLAADEGLSLVLDENGREVHRQAVGKLPPGQPSRLMVAHRPTEPGLKRYTFRLMHDDAAIGAGFAVNVQVTDGRHDVLVLEDTWRWEFKYLRRVLEDDPSFSLTAFLSRGERAFVQFGEPERRVHLGGFPHSRNELEGFDTLILGDVNPATWPKGLARNIHLAVSDGGKSLVIVAGPRLGDWVDVPELSRLLPVELSRQSGEPVSGQIAVQATAEGSSQGWFSLTPPGQSGEATSASPVLPALPGIYPALRKRPAATVLLEASEQANAHGPLVVVAEQPVGRGRVLYIGTDALWRWHTLGPRNEAGATLHSAFWQHALRALAPPIPASSQAQLWLRPEQTRYRAGDRVRLSAEWAAPGQKSAPTLEAAVVLPDGRRLPLDMSRDERDPRRFAAWFDVAEAGRYRIEATARGDAEDAVESSTLLEVSAGLQESTSSPVDTAALVRLAEATGGRVIDPASPTGWLAAGAPPAATVVRQQSFDLWHNYSIVLLLCGVLAADWLLRLFRGYV